MEQEHEPGKLTPVEQAVKAFEEQALESPELAREAYWRLLDNTKEFQKRVNRSFVLMAVFALAFELLNRGLVTDVSVGGLRLTRLESLNFVLPIAIGFEFFSAISAIRDRNVMMGAYARLSVDIYPNLHDSFINALLITPSGFITSIFPYVYINDRAGRLTSFLSAFEYVVFCFALPIGLLAYILIQLFRDGGFAVLAVWVSAVLTSMFIVIGFAIFFSMEIEDQ
jgi:hypothetical protein